MHCMQLKEVSSFQEYFCASVLIKGDVLISGVFIEMFHIIWAGFFFWVGEGQEGAFAPPPLEICLPPPPLPLALPDMPH